MNIKERAFTLQDEGKNKTNYQYSTINRQNVKPPCERNEHCRLTPECYSGCKPPVDIQTSIRDFLFKIGVPAK